MSSGYPIDLTTQNVLRSVYGYYQAEAVYDKSLLWNPKLMTNTMFYNLLVTGYRYVLFIKNKEDAEAAAAEAIEIHNASHLDIEMEARIQAIGRFPFHTHFCRTPLKELRKMMI